jgi:hypothetical protein
MNSDTCPRCGSVGKSWKLLDGSDVCDSCWLDVAMDRQALHWLEARAAVPAQQPPPFKRLVRRHQFPVRMAQARPEEPMTRDKAKWKKALAELVQPGYNSICMLCGRIYYGAAMSACSRCGGLCVQRSDHDLGLMGRHATQLVEAEK